MDAKKDVPVRMQCAAATWSAQHALASVRVTGIPNADRGRPTSYWGLPGRVAGNASGHSSKISPQEGAVARRSDLSWQLQGTLPVTRSRAVTRTTPRQRGGEGMTRQELLLLKSARLASPIFF
jgi:hypothetical protein